MNCILSRCKFIHFGLFYIQKGKNRDDLKDKYAWEQKVLDETIMTTGKVTYTAIVDFNDGHLKAAAPRNFRPEKRGKGTSVFQFDISGIFLKQGYIARARGSYRSDVSYMLAIIVSYTVV